MSRHQWINGKRRAEKERVFERRPRYAMRCQRNGMLNQIVYDGYHNGSGETMPTTV